MASSRAEEGFFDAHPRELPLYMALRERLLAAFPGTRVVVYNTQIAFRDRRNYCRIWLPIRPMRDRPAIYVIVTFVLAQRLTSPRIVEAVEPRTGRWTHHVVLQAPDAIDAELLGWIRTAHRLAHQLRLPQR
jgi:hypothetical protein